MTAPSSGPNQLQSKEAVVVFHTQHLFSTYVPLRLAVLSSCLTLPRLLIIRWLAQLVKVSKLQYFFSLVILSGRSCSLFLENPVEFLGDHFQGKGVELVVSVSQYRGSCRLFLEIRFMGDHFQGKGIEGIVSWIELGSCYENSDS